jgi:hypothetical protein
MHLRRFGVCSGSGVGAGSGRFAANCRSQAAPASAGSVGGKRSRGFPCGGEHLPPPCDTAAAWRPHVPGFPAPAAPLCHASAPVSCCSAIVGGIMPLHPGVATWCCIRCAAASFHHREHRLLRAVRVGRSAAVGSRTSANCCCSVTSALCRANQSLQWTQGRPYFQALCGLQLTRRSSAFGAALRH